MEKIRVGFVGLGIMGRPMAGHLLRAGFPLTVFNRTRAKAEELGREGAVVVDSPQEVGTASDVTITMVSDTPDVEQVVAGPQGILEGIKPGSLVVDMSTVSPELERRLQQKLREKGCDLLDAPVSGGDVGARHATLAIMVGGDRAAFERVLPILEVMGNTITYCGPVGSGQLTKLCNQILVSVNLLAVCEALVFARKNGLDPLTMIDAVSGGAASSWQLVNLGPKVAKRDFQPGFMVDLMQKDLRLVLETATANPTPLPATALVQQLFKSVQIQGLGREGTQALAKALEALAGI
ncbi:MAG TPA: NAD(P)-dependent oxidoreductase [Acidobacteriota bacterium]|nr:NAD(P)-dependent oxidoreductase [Acidobacteriota bacterium]